MKYGLLNTRNPDPDHAESFLRELGDLYEGGYTILRNARAYLPAMVGEHPLRYAERLKLSAYISYVGQIVDSFVANLFSQEITVQPAADAGDEDTIGTLPDDDFYSRFALDADLKRTTFANVLRSAFTTALVKRRALVAVDFPVVEQAASRADESTSGADRAYIYELPLEELIDWHYDDVVRVRQSIGEGAQVEFDIGSFAWAILKREICQRASPTESRGLVVHEFKVWAKLPDGRVGWQVYRTDPFDPQKPPQPGDDVALASEGTTSFCEIPIVEIQLPHGLWIGNKVCPLNREHYRRRSALLAAQQMSLLEIPTLFLGPEIGGEGEPMPAEVAQDPHRGQDPRSKFLAAGFVALGKDDDFRFVGPSGGAYKIVDDQLKDLVDEMFRTGHQMAAGISSTANSVGRSGASKAEDRAGTSIILCAYGAIMRDFARRIYSVISEARREDIVWAAHGLDHYELYDRVEVLNEAVKIDQVQIPSRTFKVAHAVQTALRLLPGLPTATQETIRSELDEAIVDPALVPPVVPASAPPDLTPKEGDEMVEGPGAGDDAPSGA